MGKIVCSLFTTVDGAVYSPHEWHFPYHNDEVGEAVNETTESQEALLLGRKLYDEWSEFWPTSKDEPFASYINGARKYVLTHRAIDGEPWNNSTALGDDPAAELRAIKESLTGDLGVSGPTAARWVASQGLLDEVNLVVDPIMVGRGERLFDSSVPLELISANSFSNGVQHLKYRVAATS